MNISTFLLEQIPTFIFYKILAKDYKRLFQNMNENQKEVDEIIKKLNDFDYEVDHSLELIEFPLTRIQSILDIIDVRFFNLIHLEFTSNIILSRI